MATKYIGADVHVTTTELAVDRSGKVLDRYRVPTTIPSLRGVLVQISGSCVLVIEEGPMAGWLYRNLREHVEKMIVCDPRRNHHIARDGDKDDPIDAAKLAALARGGYLREVYHTDDESREAFKQWVSLYHDRIGDRVRQANKIHGRARLYGARIPAVVLKQPQRREPFLSSLRHPELASQLRVLWMGYDTTVAQAAEALKQFRRRSRSYPIVQYWRELPGVGPVRAATLLAYLDTPWRFRRKNRLWKYCGLGLQRTASGSDRHGRPNPAHLHLAWQVNRRLKDAIVGATMNAIVGDNVFGHQYRRLLDHGLIPSNARHTVARTMLTVMWGMWKRTARFDASLL